MAKAVTMVTQLMGTGAVNIANFNKILFAKEPPVFALSILALR